MKLNSRVASLSAAALLTLALAGCAAPPHRGGAHAHDGMGAMDMQAMCDRHKQMMGGKTSAEQQAMMQEHMKGMTPEMHQRMQSMHQHCK
jgi:hypothetical protein